LAGIDDRAKSKTALVGGGSLGRSTGCLLRGCLTITATGLSPASRRQLSGHTSALLGFVIMSHSYDYISLFVPFFDIPVSLGSLFQRIASINDRFYLPRLNQLFEEN